MPMSADEEKTRILQRRPVTPKPAAAAPASHPEANPGEKIVFYCPNGHRIVANAALAGKRGKCSKCQVDVTIPAPDAATGPVGSPPEPVSPMPTVDERPEPAPEPDAGLPEITVGPPPSDATEAAEGSAPEGDAEERENWSFIGGDIEPPPADGFDSPAWDSAAGEGGFSAEAGNPTALLVARLWAERQHGGIIELHLDGGSVILPEWYDAHWSRGTHGLFASQAADGTVTLTAVAWETVRKVVVRQLTEVPDDMFT
jgi:hypothetical protein